MLKIQYKYNQNNIRFDFYPKFVKKNEQWKAHRTIFMI